MVGRQEDQPAEEALRRSGGKAGHPSSVLIGIAVLSGLTRPPSGQAGILLGFLVLQGLPQSLLIWHSSREALA